MQRIIQINIAGRVLPIEEDAYEQLRNYINALERQFAGEPGKEEILMDIEGRIAELFQLRLQSGAYSIDRYDVGKVIETLGMPADFAEAGTLRSTAAQLPAVYELRKKEQYDGYNNYSKDRKFRRLFRNPNDKMLGGVCGGLGDYFDIDPLLIRLIWGALALIGIGIIAYIVAWILIPEARTQQDLEQMGGGDPMNFHAISRNVGNEMKDLQKRAHGMTKDLQDFFRRK